MTTPMMGSMSIFPGHGVGQRSMSLHASTQKQNPFIIYIYTVI